MNHRFGWSRSSNYPTLVFCHLQGVGESALPERTFKGFLPRRSDSHVHHGNNMPRGLPLVRFLKSIDICIPPQCQSLSDAHVLFVRGYNQYQSQAGKMKMVACSTYWSMIPHVRLDHQATYRSKTYLPCGNDMIDAHVENLVDSKLPTGLPQSLGKVSDFTTIIWITASQLPTLPQGLPLLIFYWKGIDRRCSNQLDNL